MLFYPDLETLSQAWRDNLCRPVSHLSRCYDNRVAGISP